MHVPPFNKTTYSPFVLSFTSGLCRTEQERQVIASQLEVRMRTITQLSLRGRVEDILLPQEE